MNREETLKAAEDCVLRSRNSTHGSPEDSFGLIARFWSAYLGTEVKDYQVAIMMSLLKIARMKFRPDYEDNFVDACGYSACAAELSTKEHSKPVKLDVDDKLTEGDIEAAKLRERAYRQAAKERFQSRIDRVAGRVGQDNSPPILRHECPKEYRDIEREASHICPIGKVGGDIIGGFSGGTFAEKADEGKIPDDYSPEC